MIVTEEGKNIYPEDVETYFAGLSSKRILRLRRKLSLARPHHGRRTTHPRPAPGNRARNYQSARKPKSPNAIAAS